MTPEDPHDPTPGPAPAAARPGRGRTWLLYGSLGLNLLVVGIVAGAVLSDGPRGGPWARTVIDSPVPLIRALDPEARDAMRAYLDAAQPRGAERPFRTARRSVALLEALRADPFDPAVFEAALTAQSQALERRNQVGRSALFQVVQEMSVSERRAYADRIEQSLRDRAGRDGGDKRPPPPPSGG